MSNKTISWKDGIDVPGCTAKDKCNDSSALLCSGGGRDSPCPCSDCNPSKLLTVAEVAAQYKNADDYDKVRLFSIAPYVLEIECLRAKIHMAVQRLGGTVEGNPTGEHNFLQRIDELVQSERGQ